MASNQVPVAELRTLLSAVSEHGKQHLIEVEADLMQTSFLLSGAIEKLTASFMEIHETVTSEQEKLNAMLNEVAPNESSNFGLEVYREKIDKAVNDAITGLQFQDMTSQLITRAINRVNGLKESLSALAIHGQDMDAALEHEETAKLLEEMSAHLTIRNDALTGGLRKSVAQQDMNSGDVDLF